MILNPIELIWGDVKCQVGKENTTFKLPDVQNIVENTIKNISIDRWKACVRKVREEVVESYWKKDGLQAEGIQPLIIHLESEDESSDYEDCT